jgi:hypothetical protein
MKIIFLSLAIFSSLFLYSCKEDKTVPAGFEIISQDRNSLFVYVEREFWGDRVNQRQVGRKICNAIYEFTTYCEVWYFANRAEVPTKFPIMNRVNPIGKFEIKEGKEVFRTLGSNR